MLVQLISRSTTRIVSLISNPQVRIRISSPVQRFCQKKEHVVTIINLTVALRPFDIKYKNRFAGPYLITHISGSNPQVKISKILVIYRYIISGVKLPLKIILSVRASLP